MKRSIAVVLALATSATNALAADESAEPGPPKRSVTVVADAWQPLHGIAAAGAELRMSRDVGLGLALGAGTVRRDDRRGYLAAWNDCGTATTACERNAFVGGAIQAIFYALGTFSGPHSFQIGAEAALSHEWGDASRTRITPALLTGYKLVTAAGFTFNPHHAIGYALGDGGALSSRFVVGLGWSF